MWSFETQQRQPYWVFFLCLIQRVWNCDTQHTVGPNKVMWSLRPNSDNSVGSLYIIKFVYIIFGVRPNKVMFSFEA